MNTNYSVGIPARNEENNVIKTIESVLNQTIPPSNVYVCVNGSTDQTYQKVVDFASLENKVNPLVSPPGKANAWNEIISQKDLENQVLFCDGDIVVNDSAAENLLEEFYKDKDLVLVGGANGYLPQKENSFFSRCFTETKGKIINQNWVCGRIYMIDKKRLFSVAEELGVDLLPREIINEDGFLEMIARGHCKTIDSAYNLSLQVSTFSDWKKGLKRIIAGQKQLRENYSDLHPEFDFSGTRLRNYFERFKAIDDPIKKLECQLCF